MTTEAGRGKKNMSPLLDCLLPQEIMWSQTCSPDAGWKSGGLGVSVQYRPDTGLRAVTG